MCSAAFPPHTHFQSEPKEKAEVRHSALWELSFVLTFVFSEPAWHSSTPTLQYFFFLLL